MSAAGETPQRGRAPWVTPDFEVIDASEAEVFPNGFSPTDDTITPDDAG